MKALFFSYTSPDSPVNLVNSENIQHVNQYLMSTSRKSSLSYILMPSLLVYEARSSVIGGCGDGDAAHKAALPVVLQGMHQRMALIMLSSQDFGGRHTSGYTIRITSTTAHILHVFNFF